MQCVILLWSLSSCYPLTRLSLRTAFTAFFRGMTAPNVHFLYSQVITRRAGLSVMYNGLLQIESTWDAQQLLSLQSQLSENWPQHCKRTFEHP
jgi:hypothetical protein